MKDNIKLHYSLIIFSPYFFLLKLATFLVADLRVEYTALDPSTIISVSLLYISFKPPVYLLALKVKLEFLLFRCLARDSSISLAWAASASLA